MVNAQANSGETLLQQEATKQSGERKAEGEGNRNEIQSSKRESGEERSTDNLISKMPPRNPKESQKSFRTIRDAAEPNKNFPGMIWYNLEQCFQKHPKNFGVNNMLLSAANKKNCERPKKTIKRAGLNLHQFKFHNHYFDEKI